MTRVYLAAALSEAHVMREWAVRINRERDLFARSRWHESDATCDPVSKAVRREMFNVNMSDLQSSDVLFLQTVTGQPSCAFVELGFALALGKRCVWLQPAGRRFDGFKYSNIADASHLVTVLNQEADVIPALRRIEMASRETLAGLDAE